MKKIIAVLTFLMVISEASSAQNINWRTINEHQPNVVQMNFGYDFGITTQFSYSRAFESFMPLVVGLDYSAPMGRDLLDDFKVRTGVQIEVLEYEGFSSTLKIYGNFRRYQTALVRIVGFGSDFAALAGYYRPGWYAAGEFGFDKSIITNMQHSEIMKADFPLIKDGWYIPSGGHYYYGIQGGATLGESFDLSLRLGATRAQSNDAEAMLPMYLQLGLGVRL